MAGIYVHIPFCKQACHYCNFHFSTSSKLQQEILSTILREVDLRANYLKTRKIETIYFGGGTPSLVSTEKIVLILEKIATHFDISAEAEITLEANPDDLTSTKLRELANTPINRLSIGIQSFHDADLQFMNRAHRAADARKCIEDARLLGFDNLTIDLIYGSPTTTEGSWKKNLEIATAYNVNHLSCYCLTVEPKTALSHFVTSGKVPDVDSLKATRQFLYLMDFTAQNQFIHYEISNFARPGHFSRHNSNYWKNVPYLGLGPSAHSFDGQNRQWNIANNAKYINLLKNNQKWYEIEHLTPRDHYNEYVMTSLRTIWGCQLERIPKTFQDHFLASIQPFLQQEKVERAGNSFHLTNAGKLIADKITMELFLI